MLYFYGRSKDYVLVTRSVAKGLFIFQFLFFLLFATDKIISLFEHRKQLGATFVFIFVIFLCTQNLRAFIFVTTYAVCFLGRYIKK